MKHDDLQSNSIEPRFDNSNQLEIDSIKPLPITKFPLKNIPLYHAYYHQHNAYNASDSPHASLRNRSSIWKRASSGEKQISTNITMVLEGLLESYKSAYLPTHGQGRFYWISCQLLGAVCMSAINCSLRLLPTFVSMLTFQVFQLLLKQTYWFAVWDPFRNWIKQVYGK